MLSAGDPRRNRLVSHDAAVAKWLGCMVAYELGWAKEKSVSVDLEAPLSQWDIENSFDSAAECRNEKARLVFDGRTKIQISKMTAIYTPTA
jgi:hypothetical protein